MTAKHRGAQAEASAPAGALPADAAASRVAWLR